MNNRPEATGSHISFEIGSLPSRQETAGAAWIEMPQFPNASETAPYGVGFHPTQPAEASTNTLPPMLRHGDNDLQHPQTVSPSVPLPHVSPSSDRPSPLPQRQAQDLGVSQPDGQEARKNRMNRVPPVARRGQSPAPIPALKPARPPSPKPSQAAADTDVMLPIPPLAKGVNSVAPLRSTRQTDRRTPVPAMSGTSTKQRPRSPYLRLRTLWQQASQATHRLTQALESRMPAPRTLAASVAQAGRKAYCSGRASWGVPALWLGILALSSSLGAIAFLTLSHQPPAPDCQQLSALSADIDKLYCAQQAAQSRDVAALVAGIRLVQSWSEEHPLHREAQGLLASWSKELLAIAEAKFENSDLHTAVEVADQIPSASPVYADAQAAIARWKAEWQDGESIYKATEAAIKARNWSLANENLLELGRLRHTFWRQHQADYLAQRILDEKQAWQVLDQARKLAATNKLTQIGEAIALVDSLSPQTFVWETARADQERWSRALLTVGMQHWQQGNVDVATDLIRQIPLAIDAFPDAKDLILYSHAQHWAKSAQNQAWMPSLQQIWNLNVAIAAVRQIQPESPLYLEAQNQVHTWERQLEDLLNLKLADWLAGMGNRSAYQLAIEQAQQIASDRPRRVQAQTLMAHWKLEIERLDDRPILDRAYQMAGQGTIPMLKAAIAEASTIPQGRALRVEAQTSIAHWTLEIERIEDQPLLDEAIALADRGQLSDAIRAAQRIPQNRALYREAQSLAATWQTTLDNAAIAEDRKILNDAYGYAAKEWYSVAIDIASRISPDRPLYGEAQSAIANWKDARAAIWRARGQMPSNSAPSSSSESDYEGYYSPSERR